jgi:hypothetical protein
MTAFILPVIYIPFSVTYMFYIITRGNLKVFPLSVYLAGHLSAKTGSCDYSKSTEKFLMKL